MTPRLRQMGGNIMTKTWGCHFIDNVCDRVDDNHR